MGGIPPIVAGPVTDRQVTGSPPLPARPESAAGMDAAAAPTAPASGVPTLRPDGTPIEVGTVTLPDAPAGSQERPAAERLRRQFADSLAEQTSQLQALETVLRAAPVLRASVRESGRRTDARIGAGVRGGADVGAQAEALEQVLRTAQEAIAADGGVSVERRRQVAEVLRGHFDRYQVEAVLHWLDARVAALAVARSEVMVDVLDGRVSGAGLTTALAGRLSAEMSRSDDQMRAILAPMAFFSDQARDLFVRMRQRTQLEMEGLTRQAVGVLGRSGLLAALPSDDARETASGPAREATAGLTLAQARTHTTLTVERPGLLTQRLLEWQRQGIIAPGEMDLVATRIADGMEAPRRTGDAVTDALAGWAERRQVVLLTPSVIARLAERITDGGLPMGDGHLTPETLSATLRDLDSPAALFAALGIAPEALWLGHVVTYQERWGGEAISLAGGLQAHAAGAAARQSSAAVGVSVLVGAGGTRQEAVSIEGGVRRTQVEARAERSGVALTAAVMPQAGGRQFGLGIAIPF